MIFYDNFNYKSSSKQLVVEPGDIIFVLSDEITEDINKAKVLEVVYPDPTLRPNSSPICTFLPVDSSGQAIRIDLNTCLLFKTEVEAKMEVLIRMRIRHRKLLAEADKLSSEIDKFFLSMRG